MVHLSPIKIEFKEAKSFTAHRVGRSGNRRILFAGKMNFHLCSSPNLYFLSEPPNGSQFAVQFFLRRKFCPTNQINPLITEPNTAGYFIFSHDYQFLQGNWADLNEFFEYCTEWEPSTSLYFGDNVLQDVLAPKKFTTTVDSVAVVGDLLAEGMVGREPTHPHAEDITSKFWGSYFFR